MNIYFPPILSLLFSFFYYYCFLFILDIVRFPLFENANCPDILFYLYMPQNEVMPCRHVSYYYL